MKIVQADEIGSVDNYRIVEVDTPSLDEGKVLIKIVACGMGYVDALIALGGYQVKPPAPFTPGQEISGVVVEVGEGVTNVEAGDRVMASAFGGGLAEYAAVPAKAVYKIPDAMSHAQAAILNINYLTAMHGLKDRANLQPGERLLVFGAAGGVGTAAIQVGQLLGAEVIAVASTAEKRAFAEQQGAGATLDVTPEGWRDKLKAICEGKGPDVVFDPVCGDLFEPAFRSVPWRGRYLVVGFASGPIPKLAANLPLVKGTALIGVDVRQFLLYEQKLARNHLNQLFSWIKTGKLTPPIGQRFPFNDFANAMQHATSGKGIGKAVVEIAES